MYSGDSRSQSVYARTGFAAEVHPGIFVAMRGLGCAARFAFMYAASPDEAPCGTRTDASPPWQSAQPIRTVPVGCIDASSVDAWQVMHPALFASASAGVSPAATNPAEAGSHTL